MNAKDIAGSGLAYNEITGQLDVTYDNITALDVSLKRDLNPALGNNLKLNNNDIIGSGNISIDGSISLANGIQIIGSNISSLDYTYGINDLTTPTITIGDSQSQATVMVFNNNGNGPSIRFNNIAKQSFTDLPKLQFQGRGGDLDRPQPIVAGDYLGAISFGGWIASPDVDVPCALITGMIDNAGTDSVQAGKLEMITVKENGFNFLTFDSKGQLAVNQQDAHATVDINGVMRLVKQNAAPKTPVEGMIAVADGIIWNPANKQLGSSYPVYYNGTDWTALI